MEACIIYTVQVPNEAYGWSWTNAEGICRRKAQKGAYSAHGPEPGVAGGQIVQGQGANNGELPYSKEAAEPQPRIPSEAGDIEHVEHRMLNRPSEE